MFVGIRNILKLYLVLFVNKHGFPKWLCGKESACQYKRHGFDPWVRKIPWGKAWQPTPVFLPGESHGQKSLAGYSPPGSKSIRHDFSD